MTLEPGNKKALSERAAGADRSFALGVLKNDNLARFLFLFALVIAFAIVT